MERPDIAVISFVKMLGFAAVAVYSMNIFSQRLIISLAATSGVNSEIQCETRKMQLLLFT